MLSSNENNLNIQQWRKSQMRICESGNPFDCEALREKESVMLKTLQNADELVLQRGKSNSRIYEII